MRGESAATGRMRPPGFGLAVSLNDWEAAFDRSTTTSRSSSKHSEYGLQHLTYAAMHHATIDAVDGGQQGGSEREKGGAWRALLVVRPEIMMAVTLL